MEEANAGREAGGLPSVSTAYYAFTVHHLPPTPTFFSVTLQFLCALRVPLFYNLTFSSLSHFSHSCLNTTCLLSIARSIVRIPSR